MSVFPRGTWIGGASWRRLAKGLPKRDSYFTVQRDAMDVDELKSPALYFGTTTGQLWLGRDGGEEAQPDPHDEHGGHARDVPQRTHPTLCLLEVTDVGGGEGRQRRRQRLLEKPARGSRRRSEFTRPAGDWSWSSKACMTTCLIPRSFSRWT